MTNSCEWVRARLARRAGDSRADTAPLSDDEARALDQHLAGCPACREYAAGLADGVIRDAAAIADEASGQRAHEFLRRFFDANDLHEADRLRAADRSSAPISAEEAASAPLGPRLRRTGARRHSAQAPARRKSLLDLLPRVAVWRWATLTGAVAAVVVIAVVLTHHPDVDQRALEFGREPISDLNIPQTKSDPPKPPVVQPPTGLEVRKETVEPQAPAPRATASAAEPREKKAESQDAAARAAGQMANQQRSVAPPVAEQPAGLPAASDQAMSVETAASPSAQVESETADQDAQQERVPSVLMTAPPTDRATTETSSSDRRLDDLASAWRQLARIESGSSTVSGAAESQPETASPIRSRSLGQAARDFASETQRSLTDDSSRAKSKRDSDADSLETALVALTGALRDVASIQYASATDSLSAIAAWKDARLPSVEKLWLAAGDGWYALWQNRGEHRLAGEAQSAYERALAKGVSPSASRSRGAARDRSLDRSASLSADEIRRAEERIRLLHQ